MDLCIVPKVRIFKNIYFKNLWKNTLFSIDCLLFIWTWRIQIVITF